ncbi:MAG: hypothetical protein OCC49_05145 [Fibrobacterales bacterium]
MKKLALLLFAVSTAFIACSEPSTGTLELDTIKVDLPYETIETDVAIRSSKGGVQRDSADELMIIKDTVVEYIPVPFYLNHWFIDEGWMGAGQFGDIGVSKGCPSYETKDGGYIDEEKVKKGKLYVPDESLCKQYTIAPNFNDDDDETVDVKERDLNNWGGVAWLQGTNWGHRYDDLIRIGPGAKKISFWAKSIRKDADLHNRTEDNPKDLWFVQKDESTTITLEDYNHKLTVAVCGNLTTSCDFNPTSLEYVIDLSYEWQYYELPLPETIYVTELNQDTFENDTLFSHPLSSPRLVSTGFMWTNASGAIPADDPLSFYIDRILYSDEDIDEDFQMTRSKSEWASEQKQWTTN